MIQELGNYKYDDTFKIMTPKKGDYLVFISDNKILLDEGYNLPRYDDDFSGYQFIYLFCVNENKFFYCDKRIEEYGNFKYVNFHSKIRVHEKWLTFAISTAYHFADWYRNNRYCGRCGKENLLATNERMIYCEKCHTFIYPRINPAVIVAVIDRENDSVIVTKRTPTSTGYALISGFCEVGETVEETCVREVYEEVGVSIKNIKYYKSQPWAYSESLLLGFVAELDGDNILKVDYNENTDAFWIKRSDLDIKNDDFSLTREMLDEFAKGNL